MVEVLALARKAASSAGVRPASNWFGLISEGRVLSWSSSWITAGEKGGSRAYTWSASSEMMVMESIFMCLDESMLDFGVVVVK